MGDKKDNSLPSVCDKKSPAFGGYLKIFVLQQVYDKKLIILPKTKETTIRRMVIGWEGGYASGCYLDARGKWMEKILPLPT